MQHSKHCGVPISAYLRGVVGTGRITARQPQMERQMTNDSHGEVYGTKTLNLAVIGASVLIMLGVLWQPAPVHVASGKPTVQVEEIAAKAPVSHHVAG